MRYMNFQDYWRMSTFEGDVLRKSSNRLSKSELKEIQETIHEMQKKGLNANKIIKYLQDHNAKLAERYKAERAFYTEVKRMDTDTVKEAGEELDVEKYQVLLSPHACQVCKQKTQNGQKTFTKTDLEKSGYGHYPPFHPNCYCVLIPK